MTVRDRDLAVRVERQLQENEATLRVARDFQRRQPEIERAMRSARLALRQLRTAGLLR